MNSRSVRIGFLAIVCVSCLLVSFAATSQTTASTNGKEGYADNAGVKIWYRVEGTLSPGAVPVLMIHGGPGATARPFEKTIGPLLAKSQPVIYMDYRGVGRSDRPKDPAQYSFDILASDAEAIRKQLGIEKWSVFGHSNGGATAITYAVRYPDRVASLVLCDPLLSPADLEMNMIHKVALAPPDKYEKARAVYKSDKSMDDRFGELLNLIDMETRYRFQYFNPANSAVLERIQQEFSKELGKGLMEPALMQGLIANGFFEFDAFKSADKLRMPVMLVLGRYDSEISIDNAMKFALALPDGYVALMEKSGHHPYLEETEATALKTNQFLSKH